MKTHLLLGMAVMAAPFAVQAAFPDVPETHANSEAINYLKAEGVVAGNPDGTYAPERSISRAAFTKIVVETYFGKTMAEQCDLSALTFSDVPTNAWFAPYVCLAQNKGLIRGYDDGTFKPGNNINVAEAAKIISAHRKGERAGSPWFAPYLEDLESVGAIPTEVNSIDQLVNRGTMAEIIYRIKAGKKTKPQRKFVDIYPEAKKMMAKEEAMADKTEMMKKGATNEIFSQARFEALMASGDKFVLNFSAAWCPTCQKFKATIKESLGSLPDGTIILETDYDKYSDLKRDYGVTKQHTGVFFENGKAVSTKAGLELEDIKAFFGGEVMMEKEEVMADKMDMMKKAATNEIFSQARFDELIANGHKFVLNFSASWCPNCQKLKATIKDNIGDLPDGTIILETDYDKYTDLKKDYGVTRQTTGVFFENGEAVSTKSGLSFNDIKTFFQ